MGQYDRHVFVCTSGETCPTQGDTEKYVKVLRDAARQAGKQIEVRINKAGCFSQCGHGPMIVVYPENVWYAGVQESDFQEILTSHILGGRPVERLRYEPGVRGANKVSTDEHKSAPPAEPGRRARQSPSGSACAGRTTVPANGMKEFAVDGINVLIVNTGERLRGLSGAVPARGGAAGAGCPGWIRPHLPRAPVAVRPANGRAHGRRRGGPDGVSVEGGARRALRRAEGLIRPRLT